jgi:hypothetical protein
VETRAPSAGLSTSAVEKVPGFLRTAKMSCAKIEGFSVASTSMFAGNSSLCFSLGFSSALSWAWRFQLSTHEISAVVSITIFAWINPVIFIFVFSFSPSKFNI